MFAVYVNTPNHEDPLSAVIVGERAESKEAPKDWIRVKVTHASLNRHDIFTAMGRGPHPEGIPFPITLGCDGAGILDDGTPVVIYPVLGSPDWRGDETLDPGFNILHEKVDGTFADYVYMPARNALPLIDGLSSLHASVLGTAWLTAFRLLFTRIGITAGQTLLVQGASGGMATAFIQLASAAGVEVWVTSRTREGSELAERLGANRIFESGNALPRAVDAVVDNVGTATWAHTMQSVRSGGIIGTVGATTGDDPDADLSRLFVQQIRLVGSVMGTLEEMNALMRFMVTAKIDPEIGLVLPMENAIEGMAAMLQGRTAGKVVFTR
ncbi:MAG: zinc-binding dehydrogenase [Alphaproteobacteria bacterium]|nr:zinc-binding dehydrogenase [Alphaproteobacteria bacterium]